MRHSMFMCKAIRTRFNMKIVVRNSDSAIVQVADSADLPLGLTPGEVTVHDIAGWDWSLADLEGIDQTDINWLELMEWNGTTIVPKP